MSLEKTSKKCPFCAEEIQSEAIKCKHCGSALVQKSSGKAQGAGLLYGITWIGTFVGCFILIVLLTAVGDYFVFGNFEHGANSFNTLTAFTAFFVCGVIAQKTSKRYVRKEKDISFSAWCNPDLNDQKKRTSAISSAVLVLVINTAIGIITLLKLFVVPASSGLVLFILLITGLNAASSFFTRRMSRVWSIVGLALYSLDTLIVLVTLINFKLNLISVQENQISTSTWLVRILFLVFLVNGVRATFAEKKR